jgi:hypothetical protein
LIKWPHLLLPLVFQGQTNVIPPWAQDLSSPLLVALLLTVLLPKLPLLANIDDWITKRLRYMAAIPYEERRLSAELRKSDFHTPDDVRKRIEEQMIGRGFDPTDIAFDSSQELTYLWTKISVLMEQVAEWEGQQKFTRFMGTFSTEWDELQRAYDQLIPRIQKCFKLTREVLPGAALVRGSDAVLEYKKEVQKQVDELLESTYHFISRGVLRCELTHNARCEQLKRLGFSIIQLIPLRLTVDQVIALFMGVYLFMLCSFIVFPQGGSDQAYSTQMFMKVTMIATLYMTSVCCAIYLREWWKRKDTGFRPVAYYVTSGVLAVGVGIPINIGFRVLTTWNISEAGALFTKRYPWFFMSFMMAFVTALLSDDKPTQKLSRSRLQWVEGCAQALTAVFSAWIIHGWLLNIHSDRVPDLIYLLPKSGVIGFIIGFLVPTWYRGASLIPSSDSQRTQQVAPRDPFAPNVVETMSKGERAYSPL